MNIEKIGEIIRNERRKQGINQNSLAIKLGITQAKLSEYENGKRLINFDTAVRILRELKITVKLENHE
jgi:transcriptional regulator with XRE-family HTH domain